MVMLFRVSYPLKTCYVRHVFCYFSSLCLHYSCYMINIHDFFLNNQVLLLKEFHFLIFMQLEVISLTKLLCPSQSGVTDITEKNGR